MDEAITQAKYLNDEGLAWSAAGQYADAQPPLEHALALREKVLGSEHPDVAQSLNNLAELYRAQGRYADAEPRLQRALAICERGARPGASQGRREPQQPGAALSHPGPLCRGRAPLPAGPGHPGAGARAHPPRYRLEPQQPGALYYAQGRYAEAEPLFQRALTIREQALGPDHPDVAWSLNSLAELYRAQGRYAEAEPLFQQALAIREQALGPDHPDIATSLNNLAAALLRARPLCRGRAPLPAGPGHPRAGAGARPPRCRPSLNNLADLYHTQGRYAEAEPLYQRALAIREQALGPDHPDVALSLNNLAALYRAQGRYAEAEPLYQRALAIGEKTLGRDHPTFGTILKNYWRCSTTRTVRRRQTSSPPASMRLFPRRAGYGVELTRHEVPPGILAQRVIPDTPAAQAGVQLGDVIVRFQGHTVPDVAAFVRSVTAIAPGTTVDCEVVRHGHRLAPRDVRNETSFNPLTRGAVQVRSIVNRGDNALPSLTYWLIIFH